MMEDFIAKTAQKVIGQLNQIIFNFGRRQNFFSNSPTFIVSITTRCNFNCPHCLRTGVDDKKTIIKDLSPSDFEEVLKEAKKINFQKVSITGGEPILHPQFKELIFLIKKYNYKFNFVTNGWIHKEYWEIIKENSENLMNIFISLDGATADIDDFARNKPGSFDRLMESIKFYKNHGIRVMVSVCLSEKNFHQIEEIMDLCLNLGISSIKWITVIPFYDEYEVISDESVLTQDEKIQALRKIFSFQEKFKNKCPSVLTYSFFPIPEILKYSVDGANYGKDNFCAHLNDYNFYIDHDGGMLPCCDMNRKCKNKPLIQKLGFKKSLKITLDVISEIKKKRLEKVLDNPEKESRICVFCNENIESCLNEAIRGKK